LGYILYRKHAKLKEEYVGIDGKKIAQLRKDGVGILNEFRTPEIAYTGDTTIDVFLDSERMDFLRVKLLITEV
jgi:ribonuclease Z